MRFLKFLTLLLLGSLTVAVALGQDVQITASVGSDSVGEQDQFQFTITVSGKDSGDAEAPRLPRLQSFKVVSGPSVSSQFQWVNGKTSSTKSFIYILLPEKQGQFTIEPVDVRVAGKIYKTPPIQVRVTAASNKPAPDRRRSFNPFEDEDIGSDARRPAGDDLFVTAELDRSSAYPGQQVTLSYHLYTQVGVTGIQLQENPPLTGFWVEDLEVQSNPAGSHKMVNGKDYVEYAIKKQALFPTATGKLKIPPATFAISAKKAGDIFGLFSQTETLYRKTKEILLEVKPLPADGRPADFSNAVGSFNLTSSLDKTQVATGEAVGFRVRLEGRGNLKMIPDLTVPPMPDFTTYSSKRSDNIRSFEGNQIGGDKTWEYVIVPKAPGRQEVPSLSFVYFNPERDKYETLSTPPLSLNVVRGADSATSMGALSGSNKQSLTRQGTDINFIKLSAGDLENKQHPIYGTLWVYVLAGIPLAFNSGILLYRRKRSRQAENAALARSQKAKRTAVAHLKKAEKAGRTEARRFYDGAAAALSGYLSDKFNLPEIAVTGDTLERTLSEKSIAHEIVGETKSCLQECDFGRFVSASASPDKRRELAGRIRRNIDDLEHTT